VDPVRLKIRKSLRQPPGYNTARSANLQRAIWHSPFVNHFAGLLSQPRKKSRGPGTLWK
jgi:hypothetical protein